ncbi:GDP-mannose 4,6-dehydratase [Pseudomonas sp. UBA2684]|uniref:GDP-mannose 4,6-dehydratase n=1 Tax=Pseudomonas sp. UBA2684 TaxID=1947311 RepID=UPI000E879964|nr:GDP-mannose 4,6-dehydratase [Pseudomonas sp. UBA2684]HBX55220.1 NAD-dependent dehydratase [Pseudomonas sp.]|tara:strand:- start:8569 stop:9489 length:921 start_codon:yes stop_codon:yes gene_type:complete
MRKKILVTGLSGFVGQHLQRLLVGTQAALDWQLLLPEGSYDLLDSAVLNRMLEQHQPDAVIHLAGQTFVPEAFRDPARTLQVNLLGTLNLLQGMKNTGFDGTFLYVSSGDVYGQVAEADLPVVETLIPQPRNPYAVSKNSAELLCLQWSYTEPWRIIVARPFNHIGAGQGEAFVISNMARQIARVRLGLQSPRLDVGDIDVTRDFLDVQDVIEAYLLLLEHGRNGEVYNVCSGNERRVRDLIKEMAELAGVKVELAQDSARMRRAEQRRVVGSSDKLQKETGWKPGVNITETLRRVLSDWEERERQ